ncbi:hypothetical protein [Cellulosimicrobium marinum]|uniref:hypothetical protein n=1 Tax=Cellulosimicrobium marinum TaxID=1638992 RepID=UPI001E358B2B|nr:hypothetical protein [Cellulosimicrobium marinum]MCB7136278.1 hypothetical protein [Cellulosimicrobium marinum]
MLSMDEVVERRRSAARRRRVALVAGIAAGVLAVATVVAWQVVARTAAVQPGAVSVYAGPALTECALPDRDGMPSAYVVGAKDAEPTVVYSVRNPGVVPVVLHGEAGVRFQRELFDELADFAGMPTDDLVDSIVVPPGAEAFAQVEPDGEVQDAVVRESLDLPATVLGVDRALSVDLDPVLVLLPGTTDDPVATEAAARSACGLD